MGWDVVIITISGLGMTGSLGNVPCLPITGIYTIMYRYRYRWTSKAPIMMEYVGDLLPDSGWGR